MTNDRLVERLVGDLRPVRRRSARGDLLIATTVSLVELAAFFGVSRVRHDMGMAMDQPSFWWKLTSLGVISAVGGVVAVLSFDPLWSPRRGLRVLLLVIALCLACGWLIDAGPASALSLAARLNWAEGVKCVAEMVALSVPPIIGLGLLMRRGASTDGAGSALAVGVAAAAWGAFVFVFACPFDDPLYIAVWYTVGCGIVTLFGRVALPRLTRW